MTAGRGLGTRVVIAVGSNLGDREGTIRHAVADLNAQSGITVTALSPLYSTVAITLDGANADSPRYLNAVFTAETRLEPLAVLRLLQRIERDHGRVRIPDRRWESRTLDLDLVTYGSLLLNTPDLILPHPRAHQRAFVLQPWLDLDPAAELPGHGSVAGFRASATDVVEKCTEAIVPYAEDRAR